MATSRVLRFDPEGRPIDFSTWLTQAQRHLKSQRQDGVHLFAHASGTQTALQQPSPLPTTPPPTPEQEAEYQPLFLARDVWESRDAAACLALTDLLPPTEAVHFTQVESAADLYKAIVDRYSTPSTTSVSRLLVPFIYPDLASFETVSDLVTHLRSLDARFRAACTEDQLALAPPPMWLTIHWLVSRIPDRLATANDALLLKHPTELTIDLLETALSKIESNLLAVASASSAPPPRLFEGCAKRGKAGKKGRKGGGGTGGGAGSGGGGGAGGGSGGGGGSGPDGPPLDGGVFYWW
ncbi:unnamed protein product [Closterium sp. Yama58-4]|nr:unnamed protein product [Closterium sp. Yama58-4]